MSIWKYEPFEPIWTTTLRVMLVCVLWVLLASPRELLELFGEVLLRAVERF